MKYNISRFNIYNISNSEFAIANNKAYPIDFMRENNRVACRLKLIFAYSSKVLL